MPDTLVSAWRFRFFILSSIKTEFRVRFARSRLGGLWMILHPLSQVMIFAFVLSAVLSTKLPHIDNRFAYALYLMAGTLSWSLFAEIMTRSVTLFVDNANIIKKLVFPKIALPLIIVGTALINNLFLFFAVFIIFIFLGQNIGLALFWLPILIILNVMLGLGLGLILGVLNVFVRDIGEAMPIVMQFLFWLTPIVYMTQIIPEAYRHLLFLNPLTSLVISYQNIFLYNKAPHLPTLIIMTLLAVALLCVAGIFFHKASSEMVDQL